MFKSETINNDLTPYINENKKENLESKEKYSSVKTFQKRSTSQSAISRYFN